MLAALSNVRVLLEKLLVTATELVKIVTAALLIRLPDTSIAFGVSIVRLPVFSCLSTNFKEVKVEPRSIKLGVALEVIEPVNSNFSVIVTSCPATLLQFTLLLDIKNNEFNLDVENDIGALPVLVTYTYGTLVEPSEADIVPIPVPPR